MLIIQLELNGTGWKKFATDDFDVGQSPCSLLLEIECNPGAAVVDTDEWKCMGNSSERISTIGR